MALFAKSYAWVGNKGDFLALDIVASLILAVGLGHVPTEGQCLLARSLFCLQNPISTQVVIWQVKSADQSSCSVETELCEFIQREMADFQPGGFQSCK